MDSEVILMILAIFLIVCVYAGVIVAFMLVAGFLATYFHFTGIMWWAVSIVVFILLCAVLGMLNRIGSR